MDISFALQALTLRHIASRPALPPGIYAVPEEVDEDVARRFLSANGVSIDEWTHTQRAYMDPSGA
jgi:adenosylhomocysteinase